MFSRRKFIYQLSTGAAALAAAPIVAAYSCGSPVREGGVADDAPALFFKISLAAWSLHRALFSKQLDHLDFPLYAKQQFGIDAVEYVNQFFPDKAKDRTYLNELKKRCDDNGINSVLIMCDLEGDLGDSDAVRRRTAVENHFKWVEAANSLGCHGIRVNAAGNSSAESLAGYVVDSLTALSSFASDYGISVMVENHGGYSSNGAWLSNVLATVNKPNCGSLPDLGNFCVKRAEPLERTVEAYLTAECLEEYDRYQGLQELMPFAKGVSAKTYDFDRAGNETTIDYLRVVRMVKDAGFTGYIGIEYEGHSLSADEGIAKTKDMLVRVGQQLTTQPA